MKRMRIEQSAATCEWRFKISMKHIYYLNRVRDWFQNYSTIGLSIILWGCVCPTKNWCPWWWLQGGYISVLHYHEESQGAGGRTWPPACGLSSIACLTHLYTSKGLCLPKCKVSCTQKLLGVDPQSRLNSGTLHCFLPQDADQPLVRRT